jgi:hypothetical protein
MRELSQVLELLSRILHSRPDRVPACIHRHHPVKPLSHRHTGTWGTDIRGCDQTFPGIPGFCQAARGLPESGHASAPIQKRASDPPSASLPFQSGQNEIVPSYFFKKSHQNFRFLTRWSGGVGPLFLTGAAPNAHSMVRMCPVISILSTMEKKEHLAGSITRTINGRHMNFSCPTPIQPRANDHQGFIGTGATLTIRYPSPLHGLPVGAERGGSAIGSEPVPGYVLI